MDHLASVALLLKVKIKKILDLNLMDDKLNSWRDDINVQPDKWVWF